MRYYIPDDNDVKPSSEEERNELLRQLLKESRADKTFFSDVCLGIIALLLILVLL